MWNRRKYSLWAARKLLTSDKNCPTCSCAETRHIRRKWIVTSLRECPRCGIRFRFPKGYPEKAAEVYECGYECGFATSIPDEQTLKSLLDSTIVDYEETYRTYVDVLRAAGLSEGSSILDFGCAWGYGSRQLELAGFRVFGYEISQTRIRFASEKLGIEMLSSLRDLKDPVDCFFSSHVLEHLIDPNDLWLEASYALRPSGLFVCFVPNCNPERERIIGEDLYDDQWGQLHPFAITSKFLQHAAARHGFAGNVFSSPYDPALIASGQPDFSQGDELCIIARKLKLDNHPNSS